MKLVLNATTQRMYVRFTLSDIRGVEPDRVGIYAPFALRHLRLLS